MLIIINIGTTFVVLILSEPVIGLQTIADDVQWAGYVSPIFAFVQVNDFVKLLTC